MLFDQLTSALNSEVFEYLLEKEVARSFRYPHSFSLALIEMDVTNERNGGVKEMQADMKTLGNILRIEVRKSDILGREEKGAFGWVMLAADQQEAWEGGERVRKAVEGVLFNGKRRTISLGITTFPIPSQDLYELLQKAREHLARAKAQGGNQVCI